MDATNKVSEGTAVYTYGWDTVFGIPVPDVNKAIVDHKSSPKNFSQTEDSYTLSSDFGDWQISLGGDGKNVKMSLPLSNIVLNYTETGKTVKIKSGVAIIEVTLHYIPHTTAVAGKHLGNPMKLVLKDKSDTPTDPVMSVITLTLSSDPGFVATAIIKQGLDDWGNANLADFSHVFAVVDLNRMIDRGQWGFVTPNYTSYAYLDNGTLEKSLFGVLTMTGDRTGKSLNEQISPDAIPGTSIAGFIVSQKRALYDLVRPAIMLAYPGLTDSNFLMNDQGDTLYLTNGTSVPIKSVEYNGTTYYPKLEQLNIKSDGEVFTMNSYTTTPVAAGITATCTSTHWYTIELGSCNTGQTLNFKEYQTPSIVHKIVQSKGSHLTQLIIDIVAAIAFIILIILTDGAALIVGGLIIGLMMGANQIVPAAIEKANKDDSPSIDLLLVNSVHPIQWTSSNVFKLDYGQMNNSLQLGGNPEFI